MKGVINETLFVIKKKNYVGEERYKRKWIRQLLGSLALQVMGPDYFLNLYL